MLNYSITKFKADKGFGIEPSKEAITEGEKRFEKCSFYNTVTSEMDNFKDIPKCDLVIVNDVFCWMSRETIFKSLANIDNKINDNGFIIIRDFYPNFKIRNKNKHVNDSDVYCHKIVGSHVNLFLQIGCYQLINSQVFIDDNFNLSLPNKYDYSENRWIDALLKKTW